VEVRPAKEARPPARIATPRNRLLWGLGAVVAVAFALGAGAAAGIGRLRRRVRR
jgi:hypothetical protein